MDVEKPVAKDNEVLIKVRAASVNPLDWRMMQGRPYSLRILTGPRKPKNERLGVDVAGEVEAIGRNVTQFKPGDEVFGSCRGALAEYVCTNESALVIKPHCVTFAQAASVPVAALTGLQGLRDKGQIRPGQKVLINGAAGGVGTFAVQIAKSYGADVTGICSTRNVDMVRSLGADRVIDYTREDFTRSGQHFDLILDCVGHPSLLGCRRVLNPKGTCVIVGAPHSRWMLRLLAGPIKAIVLSRLLSQQFVVFIAKLHQDDLTAMCELMEAGKVTPVIDRHYELAGASEAIRYLEAGHAQGKVVITLEHDN
jgi:NADPH:quinone reductase-like Zn-dependent oxidoreductase